MSLSPQTSLVIDRLQSVLKQVSVAARPPSGSVLYQIWSLVALNALTIAVLFVIFIRHAIRSKKGFKAFKIYRSFRRDNHRYTTATILVWPFISLMYSITATGLFIVMFMLYWRTGNPKALSCMNLISLIILGVGSWQIGAGLICSSLDTLRVVRPAAKLRLPHPALFHTVQYGFSLLHIVICTVLAFLVEHWITHSYTVAASFAQHMAQLTPAKPDPVLLANLINLAKDLQNSDDNAFRFLQIELVEFLVWISIFLLAYIPTSLWTILMLKKSLRDHATTSVSVSPFTPSVTISSPAAAKREALLRGKLLNWHVKVAISATWGLSYVAIAVYLLVKQRQILAGAIEQQIRSFILLPQYINAAFSLLVACTLALKPQESAEDLNQLEGHVGLTTKAVRIPVRTERHLHIDVHPSRASLPDSEAYDYAISDNKQPFSHERFDDEMKA